MGWIILFLLLLAVCKSVQGAQGQSVHGSKIHAL